MAAARADDARRAAAHRHAHAIARHDLAHRPAPGRLERWLAAPRIGPVHAPVHGAVTIRYAFPDDEAGLARLAALDSAAAPSPPLLVAEVDGELRAALSLSGGAAIADPFKPAAALLDLLAARAAQLVAVERAYGPRRSAPPSWRARVVSKDGPQDVRPA